MKKERLSLHNIKIRSFKTDLSSVRGGKENSYYTNCFNDTQCLSYLEHCNTYEHNCEESGIDCETEGLICTSGIC